MGLQAFGVVRSARLPKVFDLLQFRFYNERRRLAICQVRIDQSRSSRFSAL